MYAWKLVYAPKSQKIEYVHNSGNYETRLKCSQDWSRLGFVSAMPWLRYPASIVARRVITLYTGIARTAILFFPCSFTCCWSVLIFIIKKSYKKSYECQEFSQSILLLWYLTIFLHTNESYCASFCAHLSILNVFCKYSSSTFIPMYSYFVMVSILYIFSKVFYSIVMVCLINFTPNKSQCTNSYANSDIIHAIL